ncbi:MAG: exo-alpha-sialidase [Chloroflexi bacterium]|nr:exo-alpha-sialidase [Chloroflexota bacterium]
MYDPRNLANGWEIPSLGYCDQPYVVKTLDGAWLCTMTTGAGPEGAGGQHIVATRSLDRGRTWSPLLAIEPPTGPEASWAMPLCVPSGRVYVFYTYNARNLREVLADTEYARRRVDTLGEYAFKFSDDGGLTWSRDRYYIPVRETAIDRANPYGGSVRFFWGVGKPISDRGRVWLGFAKVGRLGEGFLAQSEGWLLSSDNLLTETDPTRIRWETLPDGDDGLRAPDGPIAEETSVTALSDGSLFCTYRTVAGHPCHAYSRDGGHSWTPPAYMTYGPQGPLVNNPRAANFCWRLSDGRFLYWFHNNTARTYSSSPEGRGSRNPAWLLGGIERDGPDGRVIHWGRPEVVLYADDPFVGISYPDLIEYGGRVYITATQKTIARVHEVPDWLLARLWESLD